MKIVARALGAAAVGLMFTLAVGVLLFVKISQIEEEERQAR